MRKKEFVKQLLGLLRRATGCGIQHGGCPCNSCFHSWAQDELGLNEWLTHMFWIVVLAIRGDYKEKDIMKSTKGFCKELIEG
jgi:hypothetical protein